MKLYNFKRVQLIPTSLDKAWNFFSTPKNLLTITPSGVQIDIQSVSGWEKMYAGQIMRYKIRVPPVFTSTWVTEITHVKEPFYFADEQRFGLFAFWHHQHHFKETSEGVEMTDEIHYGIPFWLLGRLANRIFVERQLNSIFDYRFETIKNIFSKSPTYQ